MRLYEVVNDEYPKLDSYLCYAGGFQTNTVLMNEKGLYHEYQKLLVAPLLKNGKNIHYRIIMLIGVDKFSVQLPGT